MDESSGSAIRGIIEGFYGPPWSWDERAEVMAWAHDRGMTHYVYAPKDDPLHRERWDGLYPDDELAGFARLVAERTLRVGFAISPGLSIDYHDAGHRGTLLTKIEQLLDIGIDLVCLAVDDIPVRPGLGEDHAALTRWLADTLDGRAELVLVPTEYTGTAASPYLDALAAGVPASVPIGWTGPTVVADEITAADARARAAALGGRRPFLWDNYPVNDALMQDRLFLGPLRGRDPELLAACDGYAANPMIQPRSSMPALASIAGYLAGRDPHEAWVEAVDDLGIRVLAEACDGEVPRRLVEATIAGWDTPDWLEPLRGLVTWLRAAAATDAGPLGAEAEPWVAQLHAEVQVALAATRVLQAIRPVVRVDDDGRGQAAIADYESAVEQAMAVAYLWPQVQRGTVSVLGPRCSFRPVLGQWADGVWRYRAAALDQDRNALDHLVRHALLALERLERHPTVTVAVDHRPVVLDDEHRFTAAAGSVVTVTSGPVATTVVAPTSPPLRDRRMVPAAET